MPTKQLKSAIEAILFLQHKPFPLARLMETIDETIEADEYRAALAELIQDYQVSERGVELAEVAGGYLFRTKIEHRDMIRRMHQITPVRMSQAMLEVLSIVAFYQPVTREKLEEIRGVECGHHLRNLMEKKLVRMVGRSDAIGRPMLYGTSKEFLELFGLPSLKEMPTLQEIEDMLPKNEVGEVEDEEKRIRGELQVIVANAKELEFSDIELEEQKLFGEENDDAKEDSAQATENHHRRAPKERAEAPNAETRRSELQSDEVAGTIAFGSISATQEIEWELNEIPGNASEESARAESSEASEGEATEDNRQRRDHQP